MVEGHAKTVVSGSATDSPLSAANFCSPECAKVKTIVLGFSEQAQARCCWEAMKHIAIALASTAGLLVLAGCSNAPYRTAAAPEYQSYDYVGPTEAPNALYGENYVAPYGGHSVAPY